MREILFRAKDTSTNKWVYGFLTHHCTKGRSRIFNADEQDVYDVFTNTIGQFTGELDVNGVQIFEGDIVSVRDGADIWGCYEFQEDFEVRYSGMEFSFHKDETSVSNSPWCMSGTMQVIGNIHDKQIGVDGKC